MNLSLSRRHPAGPAALLLRRLMTLVTPARLTLLGALWLSGCASVSLDGYQPPDAVRAAQTGSSAQTQPAAPPATATAPAARASEVYNAPLSTIAVESASLPAVATLVAPTDLWDRIRRGLTMPDLYGDLVREREQWYASRPDYIQRMTERANRYLFHIVEEVERRNLPMELALLPFIESAFNPQAVSSARAAGMWQFMPATGESFDLKQNAFRDDRRDVLASTNAALDYLEQLHARFGDWHLALAAYNWGQGNVNRAITRNREAGLPTSYADLTMPLETRQYVPKLQAVENILARPQDYGISLRSIGNHPYFDTITLHRDIDVALIARLSEVSETDFRALNPSIRQPVVMAAGTPQILLPWDNAERFEQRLAQYTGPLASWTAWMVPRTMSAADAARQVGMSEAELRRVNNIPPRMKVRGGSSLLVARQGANDRDVSERLADNAQLAFQPEVISRGVVVVRRGDTLSGLARKHGVSAANLAKWNRLSLKSHLKIGQRLSLGPRAATQAKATASRKTAKASRSAKGKPKAAAKKPQRTAAAKKRP